MKELKSHDVVMRIAFIALVVFLTLLLKRTITDSPNVGDASQNIVMAYNLAYHGVYALTSDLAPSHYREPFANYALALFIRLDPILRTGQTSETINQGEIVKRVKHFNLVWSSLCLVGLGLLTFHPFRHKPYIGYLLSFIAIVACHVTFFEIRSNTILTELPAGMLMIWGSYFLCLALEKRRLLFFCLSGVFFGALALTKAIFLYVFFGLVIVLAVIYLIIPAPGWPRRKALVSIVTLAAGFAILVVPWVTRNYILFGTVDIAERGERILLVRAYMNQMPIAGGFYMYAPDEIKANLGNILGYSEADLELGGRIASLRRVSPWAEDDRLAAAEGRLDDAIGYNIQAAARIRQLENSYREQNLENPELLAADTAQQEAISAILAEPGKHLMTTLVFSWRGFWSMSQSAPLDWPFEKYTIRLLNFSAFVTLWAFALIGIWKRHPVLLGTSLVAVGGLAIYALTSHFIPRYSQPMIPGMLASFFITVGYIAIYIEHIVVNRMLNGSETPT